jgi:calcineurin-like phosphoesterase family protein
MTARFFTSDLHLGHRHVARLRGFDSVGAHDRAIIDGWCSTVGKRDVVWVLGDIAVRYTDYALDILRSLPGKKHLIAGNHDGCHPLNRRAHIVQRRYLEAFDSVAAGGSLRIAGQTVVLSHFPYVGDHADRADRFTQWRLRDEGTPLLCGHVHEAWQRSGHQFNVGVDHSPGMAPYGEGDIRRWLATLTPLEGSN